MIEISVMNMRTRTVRLDREGDYWTDDERRSLEVQFHSGVGITEMSLAFQRSEPAIFQQIEKMDLYNRKGAPKRRRNDSKPCTCACPHCEVDQALCPHTVPCDASEEVG